MPVVTTTQKVTSKIVIPVRTDETGSPFIICPITSQTLLLNSMNNALEVARALADQVDEMSACQQEVFELIRSRQ